MEVFDGELNYDNTYFYSNNFQSMMPVTLHFQMFELCVKYLGDEEQVAELMPQVTKMNIIGNYCQTEMGHGSNVQGLLTTAKYDPKTQDFVINTPCVSATKMWPGDLGCTSSHAAVFAQLEVDGKQYGPQCFIV
jgi:acyl-CoA oxidase